MNNTTERTHMVNFVFHHYDRDGFMSAICMKLKLEEANNEVDTRYISCKYEGNYSDHFADIKPGDKVFILDFSFKDYEMFELVQILGGTDNIVWIDHHSSAIEKLEKYKDIAGIRYVGEGLNQRGACELTWMWVTDGRLNLENNNISRLVEWTGIRDTYRHIYMSEEEQDTLEKFYLGSYNFREDWDPAWFDIAIILENYKVEGNAKQIFKSEADAYLQILIDKGESIKEYSDFTNNSMKNKFFEATFKFSDDEYKVLCCNSQTRTSAIFMGDDLKYDGCCVFAYDGEINKFRYSVFSDERTGKDMSRIATHFQGGGREHAAGFTIPNFIFDKEVVECRPMHEIIN